MMDVLNVPNTLTVELFTCHVGQKVCVRVCVWMNLMEVLLSMALGSH